jgi:hypothetical protein
MGCFLMFLFARIQNHRNRIPLSLSFPEFPSPGFGDVESPGRLCYLPGIRRLTPIPFFVRIVRFYLTKS